jgi:exosortase J
MKLSSGIHSSTATAELPAAYRVATPLSSYVTGRPTHPGTNRSFWLCLVVLVVVGAIGLSQAFLSLWDMWTDDPLRSIGVLIVPAGMILTLRVWRQSGWELRGRWWGLLLLLLGFLVGNSRQWLAWSIIDGGAKLNLLAPKLAIYFYASGVVLLFAGSRVWRRAWFPLALLLCAQPLPPFSAGLVDLPLQNLSAHVARSFATAIGFAPANHELLRLMFTPDFGMFIAPGCDGLRGALTLGYAALIVGYLKRVSIPRWILYVLGGVLLGHVLNLARLCALVVYYRMALGHPALEHAAKNADYVIGGSLILIASAFFLWVVMRDEGKGTDRRDPVPVANPECGPSLYWRVAALAALVILFFAPGMEAWRHYRKSFVAAVRDGELTRAQLDSLMPKQIGDYSQKKVWQEEEEGVVRVQSAAYAKPGADRVILGISLRQNQHTMHDSWIAHGEDPQQRKTLTFFTSSGRAAEFDSAYYDDGVTASFAGNVFCTPESCLVTEPNHRLHMEFKLHPTDFSTRGSRAVSIFFRVEAPHVDSSTAVLRQKLAGEAADFLAGADLTDLSRKFQ